jgi:hypothetical protein
MGGSERCPRAIAEQPAPKQHNLLWGRTDGAASCNHPLLRPDLDQIDGAGWVAHVPEYSEIVWATSEICRNRCGAVSYGVVLHQLLDPVRSRVARLDRGCRTLTMIPRTG